MVTIARSDSPWGPVRGLPPQPDPHAPANGERHAGPGHRPRGSRRGRGRQLVDGLPRLPPGLRLLAPPRPGDLPRAGDLGRGRLARRERRPAGRARGGGRTASRRTLSAVPPDPHRLRRAARPGVEPPAPPEARRPYALDARPGWLTLRGEAASLGAAASPTWVGRRQQHLSCRVATLVDFVPGPRRRGGRDQRLHEPGPPLRDRRAAARAGAGRCSCASASGRTWRRSPPRRPLEGHEPVVLQVEATPEEYAFSFGIAMSGTAARRQPPARQGPRALPLVRGGRRLHRRLLRPVRDGQRPARLGAGPLRLVRLRAAVRGGGAGRHERLFMDRARDALITGTIDSLSRPPARCDRLPSGVGDCPPLGTSLLMSGASGHARPVRALPNHRRTRRTKDT